MLHNVSYNNPDITRQINEAVGKPYSLMHRIKRGGVGSERLRIMQASPEIAKLLDYNSDIAYCNIEFRPGGIIVRFRHILETYAWVIPWWKLAVIQNGKSLTLYREADFMRLEAQNKAGIQRSLVQRLLDGKAAAAH